MGFRRGGDGAPERQNRNLPSLDFFFPNPATFVAPATKVAYFCRILSHPLKNSFGINSLNLE
jgi:hypothetical protein